MIKEEDRLAAVVADIDEQVAIAPRGAFVKTPHGAVLQNRILKGKKGQSSGAPTDGQSLSVTEAGKQQNYCHFREPVRLNEKSLLEKADLDKSIDFLDPINEDIPKGSWSLKFERGSGLVTITSLLWPGTTFYHVPHTRKYGWIYVGTGEKNKDLPFML
ncbi:putative radial spoke head protein 9-like [Apostichopus japonicus]|uniref:Radial spoke head protein 9 homolog n=1 Tax=Stichopus japonicus TaxID=307972 RepID=A0A2G8LD81_STIJA|nr:putative radial spoke head protein 9-like [Apostichopus japonicus]